MDSGSANIGNSHMQNGNGDNYGVDFLGGIQSYANNAEQDDMHQFLHPDLFEPQSQDFNAAMQQPLQQQPQQSRQPSYASPAFAQNVQRTQSPSMQSYGQAQQFQQQSQYPQGLYDQRNIFQQTQYDPRLFQQRPSHSPSPNDQYTYPAQNFPSQNGQGQMIQPRPSASPAPQYHPTRQQIYASYPSFDNRGPTLPQRQDADLLQFANFQNGNQTTSHTFVNPSMLNAEPDNLNGSYGQMPHRQVQQPYYGGMQPNYPQQQQMQGIGQTLQPQQMQAQVQQYSQPAMAQPTPKVAKDPNAPKRPRGRPRTDGSIPKTDGGAGSASSSDLEIEEEEPETTPAMITVSLPTDERVKYPFLAVKAVWSPRNKAAPVEKIKTGIVDFGENLRSLRDAWKARNDSLKQAELETSSTVSDAPRLKAEVAQYRQTAETLINKSLMFAHPAIVKSLGENLYTLSAMYSFMLDRVTAVDYESTLLLAMLKFGEQFATLDNDKLESSKWIKLLQRLAKKGSGETKALGQKIMENAKTVTANNKKAAENRIDGDVAAGVKRTREGDVTGPATKRVVKTSSKPLALQNAEKRRAQEAAEAAKKGKMASSSGTLITPAAAKPKAPLTALKGTSFASLMSASKKPGTTNAERLAAVKKDGTSAVQQVKNEPLKRDSPPASAGPVASKGPSFFSSLFTEEKKPVTPKKEEEIPNETPEQKFKRLRKESRRKLRVSWKNDGDLVETRLFTHDPDEEISRGDSAMKDAGDTGKEGEMLKRSMSMQDLDDDEDDADFDPDCYSEPSDIDFAEMATVDCNPDENGIKHGGNMKAESKSAEAQDKLEETSIMAMYASASDRPDTPKEAFDEGEDDFNPNEEFGEPEEKVRTREKEMYARRRSQGFGHDGNTDFASSLQAMTSAASQQYVQPAAQNNSADLFSQLSAMGLIQNQPAQQQQAAPAATQGYDLASLIANFSGQAAAQPYQQAQQSVATAQTDSLQAIMARIQQGQGNATPTYTQTNDYDGKKGKKAKKAVPKDEKGRPLNYKTKTCEFWEKGTCLYGDDCNYRHSN